MAEPLSWQTIPAGVGGEAATQLVWFNESMRQIAAWHMAGTLGKQATTAGRLVSTPALPAGWRIVGSVSERFGETELFLQSDSGQLGMWVFNGRTFDTVPTSIPHGVGSELESASGRRLQS